MRLSSFVGRGYDEKTKIAWCVRTKDDRRSLILQTRQLLDRFENRIGPTTVAWCVRVKDIRRINRPNTDQSQFRIFVTHRLTQIGDPLSVKMAKVDAEHKTWARPARGNGRRRAVRQNSVFDGLWRYYYRTFKIKKC